MRTRLHRPKCLSLKILRVSPYNSEILVLSRLEVYCFHRPEGEGVPHRELVSRALGGVFNSSRFGLRGHVFSPTKCCRRSFAFRVVHFDCISALRHNLFWLWISL
jgi:hypothetical protein